MSMWLLNPTGQVAKTERQEEKVLEVLGGKKVGFIFNQHACALDFWKALEQEVVRTYRPAAVHRIYKENTWAPAPKADVDELVRETDYALVGVGA